MIITPEGKAEEKMTKILCIETATVNCSVAVFIDGELISIRESNTGGYSHSENLHVYIKEVLAESHLEMKDIDAAAVSRGPGSYTGLRIGVSAAKGLAYAVGVPLIAVDTLRLIALAGRDKMDASLYVPMIDARRMEVYTAVYDSDMCGVKEITASIVDEMTYDFLPDDKTVCFLGDGMKKCREVIKHPHAVWCEDIYPSARYMWQEAFHRYENAMYEDVAYFEPFYLKDFVGGSPSRKK